VNGGNGSSRIKISVARGGGMRVRKACRRREASEQAKRRCGERTSEREISCKISKD